MQFQVQPLPPTGGRSAEEVGMPLCEIRTFSLHWKTIGVKIIQSKAILSYLKFVANLAVGK